MKYSSFVSALTVLEGKRQVGGSWEVHYTPLFNQRFDEVMALEIICFDRRAHGKGKVTEFSELPVEVLEAVTALKRALKIWQSGDSESFQPWS